MRKEHHHLVIRGVDEKDLDSLVSLNNQYEIWMARKDRSFFEIHKDIPFFYVIEHERTILGFAMVTDWMPRYDSLLHRWFVERFPKFYYIDRIVIDRDHRKKGLGSRLYNIIIAGAKAYPLMCEVAIEPENTESLRFHEKFGFETIGEYSCYGKTFRMLRLARLHASR